MAVNVAPSGPTRASLVLGGGVALGAFQVGMLELMSERADISIGSISGASIGAINGAIMAGNAPQDRLPQLHAFWDAVTHDPSSLWIDPLGLATHGLWRTARNWTNALATALSGAPSLFSVRGLLPGRGEGRSLYDNEFARQMLTKVIDFNLLNTGSIRFCLAATDIERGEAVFFDTARGDRIGIDHILASSSLLTAFEPVRIGDRLLADGGLSCNVPLEAEIGAARVGDPEPLCVAIDLFTPGGPAPRAFNRTVERSFDMMFGMQTRVRLAAFEREWRWRTAFQAIDAEDAEARAAGVDLLYFSYHAAKEEAGFMKPFDFSRATLKDRREAGRQAARQAFAQFRPSLGEPGLRVHRADALRLPEGETSADATNMGRQASVSPGLKAATSERL